MIENLQPAEIVSARYPTLPVIYTAGQFGDDAASLLSRLAGSGKRIVGIVDADLGGVRIARRLVEAAPGAEIIDVGGGRTRRARRSTATESLFEACAC